MGNADPDPQPTASILQEAVDAIAREFGYPDEFTLEYDATEPEQKRTQFIVTVDEESEDDVLVLKHDAMSSEPDLATDET